MKKLKEKLKKITEILNNIKKEDQMLVQYKIVQLTKDLEIIEYHVRDIISTIDSTKRLLKDFGKVNNTHK